VSAIAKNIWKDLDLDDTTYGVAMAWPNFDDGRKGRVFVADPRLVDEGDNDPELIRQVIREFLLELAEEFK